MVSSSPTSAGANLPGFRSGSPSTILPHPTPHPFLTLQCSQPPPLLRHLCDPVGIPLASSRLSLNAFLWAPYFKSFAGNSSGRGAGVAFNPLHLFPLNSLGPCLVDLPLYTPSHSFCLPIPAVHSTRDPHLPALFRVQQPLPEVRSREKEEGRGCLCQESLIPLHPPLTPRASPSGWLPYSPPLQAPETPSTPPCPFQRKGREGAGTSGGCLQGAPRPTPPPPGMQLAGLLEEAGRRRRGEHRGQRVRLLRK